MLMVKDDYKFCSLLNNENTYEVYLKKDIIKYTIQNLKNQHA